MASRFYLSEGRKIKIVYVKEPTQLTHLVVAIDKDDKKIVATFITDGEVSTQGYKDTGNVTHEVLQVRNFGYIIIIDHWLEGPIIVTTSQDAYKNFIQAFTCLGYRIDKEKKGVDYEYVILTRD